MLPLGGQSPVTVRSRSDLGIPKHVQRIFVWSQNNECKTPKGEDILGLRSEQVVIHQGYSDVVWKLEQLCLRESFSS